MGSCQLQTPAIVTGCGPRQYNKLLPYANYKTTFSAMLYIPILVNSFVASLAALS